MSESNVLVAQSGGPTTVINASLAGVISAAMKEESIGQVYGSLNGIQGVFDKNLIKLADHFKENETLIDLLKKTPSMFLGSCRYKLPECHKNNIDYENIFQVFSELQIKYFFYIGGNDSMDTVAKLTQYAKMINFDIKMIGIPKTIDNDLVEIDHTPGYGSAAKYIASSVLEIAHDTYIYDIESVIIIEIMGRDAGWLAAASALARNDYSTAPHLIYLPERPFSAGQFVADIKDQFKKRKQVIIAVSEGIKDQMGTYISAKSTQVDQFGHAMLNGTGKYLEGIVQNTIGCKVRSIELNVLQRCAAHISSLTDINEAFTLGEKGVEAALKGHSGEMVILRRLSDSPYQVEYATVDINLVANAEKNIPDEWINVAGNDIKRELIEYMKPLILGEVEIPYEGGVPKYLFIEELIKTVIE